MMHSPVQHINPATLHKYPAFTQVVAVTGSARTIYVGGQDAVEVLTVATWGANHPHLPKSLRAQRCYLLHNPQEDCFLAGFFAIVAPLPAASRCRIK